MRVFPKSQQPQLKDVYSAWEPEYELDPLVKLTTSRWFFLRWFGEARKTVLQSKLMLAIPAWAYLGVHGTGKLCIGLHVAVLVTTVVSPWNERLLLILFGCFFVCAMGWFSVCWAYRNYLMTPHKTLALLPDQEVRRGCLVDKAERPSSVTRKTSAIAALFSRRGQVALVDFEFRSCAYRLRSCVVAVVLLASAAVGSCVRFHAISSNTAARIYLLLVILKSTLFMDTMATTLAGVSNSLYGQIAVACLRCDRTYHFRRSHFVPFDPRATCLQNLAFSSFLVPYAIIQLRLVLLEPDWARCPSMWVSQATNAFLILLLLQLGAAYSFCPFTFAVGVLVQVGKLPPPIAQHGEDHVRMLTYGIMGPIVELPDSPLELPDATAVGRESPTVGEAEQIEASDP